MRDGIINCGLTFAIPCSSDQISMDACTFGMAAFQPLPVNASGDQLRATKRKTIRKIALVYWF
jgi:hypothetical protein